MKDTLLLVKTGDTVRIDLTLERKATLYVNVIQKGEQVRRDSFQIERRHFTYAYLPVPGENLLKFELIDRRGNVSYKDVRIIYTPKTETALPGGTGKPGGETGPGVTETVKVPAEMEAGLKDYLDRLKANTSGELKSYLSGIDLAALGILTVDELNEYLLEHAEEHGLTEDEVSRLLAITPSNEGEATEMLRQDLASSSSGALQQVLMELDLEKEGIRTREDLIGYLRDHADEHTYTRQDVNDLIISDMQKEYLAGYRDQLIGLTDNEALRTALGETDLSATGSLQGLYEHLLSEAEQYGYTARDVNNMFSRLSQSEELRELIENLSEIASGDLQTVLQGLDPAKAGIKNPVQLMSYLMKESEDHDYSREDAVRLLLDYLEKEDLQEIIKLLIGTSSGDLLNLLLNLDPGQQNINSLDDLYRYLIEQARYHDYTEEDVVRTFLNLLKILEYEPIVEVIPPAEIPPVETPAGRNWIFYIMGGVALILLIILFSRRRKKDGGDETA